ncbi:MAG TPA: 23S rRNA (pseudouridine(1915)-N(3))-methyltransferase RlmH [Candidatus Saccharimonadales bacterium]|nr:23S rRNA (pseudouridine(1915)-N(3))-methyltransferase RlmH [Candidatus Saccharimonadales bacterium]
MPICIIAVGKKHESWVDEGIRRYQKRLKRLFEINWNIIGHSGLNDVRARQEESQRILSAINANDYVILLDERGKSVSSPELSALLLSKLELSRRVVIVIGGAYGVGDTIMNRADFVWSLSSLVFPHQLVRLILTEQIYRAQEINSGNPYHHN